MSMLGFHCNSSHRNGAGLLLDAGAPLVVMVDQNMIDEAHDHGAFAAYRTQHSPLGEDNPDGLFDAPLDSMPAFAGQWMNSLRPIYNLNPGADCYIINNELDPPTPQEAEKLNLFYLRCMGIAEVWGFKIGICSFSSGNPSDDGGYSLEDRWLPLLPAVQHAAPTSLAHFHAS